MNEKASPEEEKKKIMRYLEIEKECLIDKDEILLFAKLQLTMMNHPYPINDTPGYLRRCACLVETLLKEKLLEGVEGVSLSRTIIVGILDKDGNATGRAVPVEIEYHLDTDKSYGENADGNQGIKSVEYVIDGIQVAADMSKFLLKEEIDQVIRDAKTEFNNSP